MNMTERLQRIAGANKEVDVRLLLDGLKTAELREVARHFSVHVNGSTKGQMIDRITEGTVGAKLRSAAIRRTPLK